MKNCIKLSLFALLSLLPAALSGQEWLRSEIEAFKLRDAEEGVTSGEILFLGSSSIRLWDGLDAFFPGHRIVKRGFGGSSIKDAVYYFDDLVKPHSPSQIILYFGDNDLSNDYPVAEFMKDVNCFVRMVRIIFPKTGMSFISIKPSPSRRAFFGKYEEANECLKQLCESTPGMSYIDIWAPMVDKNNRLRDVNTFTSDSLHMTPRGYAVWAREIAPHLRPAAPPKSDE